MNCQQVSENFSNIGNDTFSYIALAVFVWMFLRLLQSCFAYPRRMNKQTDIQQMLQEKINDYEKYLKDCEEKERAAGLTVGTSSGEVAEVPQPLNGTPPDKQTYEEKWKERREFLDMLKKELQRIRDGGDPYDWGCLLDNDSGDAGENKAVNVDTEVQESEQNSDAVLQEENSPKERNQLEDYENKKEK